jgi:hypothetical protein
VPTALPYPEHLDLASLGSRHYLHQLPERFIKPTKIIITKREKTSSTPQGDDAKRKAPRYRGSTRCADRCNPRPAGSGLFWRVGDRCRTSIRSRAATPSRRRPETRNPVIHPKAGRRIGAFPGSGYRGSTRSRRRSLQPVTGAENPYIQPILC